MFHHVLIGYDGSANGKKALEYGIDFAMHAGSQLTIVTVVPRIPDYYGLPQSQHDEILARLTAEAQQIADMGAEQARACNLDRVQVDVVAGAPAESILALASSRGCDCIVVGALGRDGGPAAAGRAEVLLGTVSDRLVRHAKVPVLVVR